MNTYTDILLLALVTIYIVDVSGWTQAWRSLIANKLGVMALKPLPPFDCGKCMTWWACLTCAVILHSFTLPVIAYCAGLSLMSEPLGDMMKALRELAGAVNRALYRLSQWTPRRKKD